MYYASGNHIDFLTSIIPRLSIEVKLESTNVRRRAQTKKKVDELANFCVNLPEWFDKQNVNIKINHTKLQFNELDELCTQLKEKRKHLEFGTVEMRGTHWSRSDIHNQKAMNFLLARSKRLILKNSQLDLRKSEEMLEANSVLDNLTLTDSEFHPPLLWDSDSFPIQIKTFNGNIDSLANSSSEIYCSIESMTVKNSPYWGAILKFLKQNRHKMTRLKHISCLELSNKPMPITEFLLSERKLDSLELNIRCANLSRILDMMYTVVSKKTIIRVQQLTADIKLLIKGIDAGLLPSYMYPEKRQSVDSSLEEVLMGIPKQ